ncbi:MAG: ABC transporter permease [Acidobacteria bacterium]|nr:ABC transporter permease [Acidobacteriota bacterium]
MSLYGAGVVFRKEVVDNLRDRRTLFSSLVYPLLGPVLLVLIVAVAARSFTERAETDLELPVVGAEHAASLVSFLEQHGVDVLPAPEDPEAAVRSGESEVVLVIGEAYADAFAAGRSAPVELLYDDTRPAAGVTIRRAQGLLEAYGREAAVLRLLARGVDPQVIRPVAVMSRSLATAQGRGANFLGMAPYFIIFSIFLGGMYLAIDSTAGERERHSLEPLLTNPVPRWQLVLGKYGATLVFTAVALTETLLGFAVVLNVLPLEDYLGVRFQLGVGALVGIFLITVPMMLLAAALQIVIATFTRSFKEAQTYLSLLPLVPALPGLFLVFLPVETKLWMMLVPTFGQQLLIQRLMRGEGLEPLHVAVSAVVTLLAAGLFLALAMRLYRSERTVFGR